jgi:hypothetical protein
MRSERGGVADGVDESRWRECGAGRGLSGAVKAAIGRERRKERLAGREIGHPLFLTMKLGPLKKNPDDAARREREDYEA